MVEYSYGRFMKVNAIPQIWTASDYLINNNTLKLSKVSYYDLVPDTSAKHLNMRFVIYAMLELDKQGKKHFGFVDIEDNVRKNKFKYGALISEKIRYLVLQRASYKNKSNTSELINSAMVKLENNLKFRKDNLYWAIFTLIGVIIERKSTGKKNPYYLNSEGKKLQRLFYDDNYLL